jgi:hypothetical protein
MIHPRDLSVKNILPTMSELENSNFLKAASYILLTACQPHWRSSSTLGVMEDEGCNGSVCGGPGGISTYIDIADNFLVRKKTRGY